MKKNSAARYLILVTQVGFSVIVPAVLMTLLGIWLDGKLGTRFLVIIGAVLGIAGGVTAAWHFIRRFMPENDKNTEEYDLMAEWSEESQKEQPAEDQKKHDEKE